MPCDTFAIEVQREPKALRLRLSGELDLAAQAPLQRLVDLLSLQQTDVVLVDTSDAEFVDASVVGALFQLAREVRRKGGVLSHVDARGAGRAIWRLTGWSAICTPAPAWSMAGLRPF
jgi:anti-anti-sigma factor